MPLGFEAMGNAGGDGFGALVLPALLGGVLNGDMRSSSDLAGSRLALGFAVVSIDCGFEGILGLPARLTGGGMGGAEAVGRSLFRGSPAVLEPVGVAESGFASGAGVPFLLANFQGLDVTGVDGESRAACDVGRDGRGERIGGARFAGGDLGELTVTLGGERVRERVGERGGEKATMDVGRGLGWLQGARRVEERGVGLPLLLRSLTLGEVRSKWSRGMSSEMRPSERRWSSATARRSGGPGERWRGLAGAGAALLALRRFSNCARRDETGFYARGSVCVGEHRHVRGGRWALDAGRWALGSGCDVQWTRPRRQSSVCPCPCPCWVPSVFLLVSRRRKGSCALHRPP